MSTDREPGVVSKPPDDGVAIGESPDGDQINGDQARQLLFSKRDLLKGIGALSVLATIAEGSIGGSGGDTLYGGIMALDKAYKVGERTYMGPDDVKDGVISSIPDSEGWLYRASDTEVDYWLDDNAWQGPMGVGSSGTKAGASHFQSLSTEKVNDAVYIGADDDPQSLVDTHGSATYIFKSGTHTLTEGVTFGDDCVVTQDGGALISADSAETYSKNALINVGSGCVVRGLEIDLDFADDVNGIQSVSADRTEILFNELYHGAFGRYVINLFEAEDCVIGFNHVHTSDTRFGMLNGQDTSVTKRTLVIGNSFTDINDVTQVREVFKIRRSENCIITNNYFETGEDYGIRNGGGGGTRTTKNIQIFDNIIEASSQTGTDAAIFADSVDSSDDWHISGNMIISAQRAVVAKIGAVVSNNRIIGYSSAGVRAEARCTIRDNTILSGSGSPAAIFLEPGSADSDVLDNIIKDGWDGIYRGASDDGYAIYGNVIRDLDQRAIRNGDASNPSNTVIADNFLKGNGAAFDGPWSNATIRSNRGYTTETRVLSGTFAIDSTGAKTKSIAHGLDVTPAVEDCSLTIVEDTDVDDWEAMLKITGTDATNVDVVLDVTSASGTASATAKVAVDIDTS